MANQEFINTVMKNLRDSVNEFKILLSAVIKNEASPRLIVGRTYLQFCASSAIFYFLEMEKSIKDFKDFPYSDQQQINFWTVQMKDELRRILGKSFMKYYN